MNHSRIKKTTMKKLFAISVIAIAIVVGCGVLYLANNIRIQKTIVRVFTEQSKAANKFQAELQESKDENEPPRLQTREVQQALKTYAQAVQSIDASMCPKNFRLAWFDYVTAVTDLSNKNLAATAFKDALELGMSAWTKDGKLAEDALQDTNPNTIPSYYHRCQRIAVSYGVRFYPIANQQSVPAAQPTPVPVTIRYRKSLVGNGYVFKFFNTGTQELFLTITVRNSTLGKVFRMDLMPKMSKEVGKLQGWQAFPGDTCKVEADGFAPINGTIPSQN